MSDGIEARIRFLEKLNEKLAPIDVVAVYSDSMFDGIDDGIHFINSDGEAVDYEWLSARVSNEPSLDAITMNFIDKYVTENGFGNVAVLTNENMSLAIEHAALREGGIADRFLSNSSGRGTGRDIIDEDDVPASIGESINGLSDSFNGLHDNQHGPSGAAPHNHHSHDVLPDIAPIEEIQNTRENLPTELVKDLDTYFNLSEESLSYHLDHIVAGNGEMDENYDPAIQAELDNNENKLRQQIMDKYNFNQAEMDMTIDIYVHGSRADALKDDLNSYIDTGGFSKWEEQFYIQERYGLNDGQFYEALSIVEKGKPLEMLSEFLPENKVFERADNRELENAKNNLMNTLTPNGAN